MGFVKVYTDEGITGVGEATLEYKEKALIGAVEHIKEYLVGKNPLDIEKHFHDIYGNSTFNVNRWSMDYQSELLEKVIECSLETDGICGTLIWQFCDSPSNKDVAKANGFNNKGILDAYRRPKTAFRTIQKLYFEI